MSIIELYFPALPPTANNIWRNRRGGGKCLTKQASEFKLWIADYLLKEYMEKIQLIDTNLVYDLYVEAFFDRIFNSETAKDRIRAMDVDNRIKFANDCITTGLGLNDSHIFGVAAYKYEHPGNEHMAVYLSPAEATFSLNLKKYTNPCSVRGTLFRQHASVCVDTPYEECKECPSSKRPLNPLIWNTYQE